MQNYLHSFLFIFYTVFFVASGTKNSNQIEFSCYEGKQFSQIENMENKKVLPILRKMCPLLSNEIFHMLLPNITSSNILGEGGAGVVYKFTNKSSKLFEIDRFTNKPAIAVKIMRNLPYFEIFQELNAGNCMKSYNMYNKNSAFELSVPQLCYQKEKVNDGSDEDEIFVFFLDYYDFNLISYFKEIKKDGDYFHKITKLMIMLCIELKGIHSHDFLHRDIKPQNIMVDKNGYPHLGDFGIATPNRSEVDERIGSPPYMSPKVARSEKYDRSADFFSLGLVFNNLVNQNFKSHYKMLEAGNYLSAFNNNDFDDYNLNTKLLDWPEDYAFLKELLLDNISHDKLLDSIITNLRVVLKNRAPILILNKNLKQNTLTINPATGRPFKEYKKGLVTSSMRVTRFSLGPLNRNEKKMLVV